MRDRRRRLQRRGLLQAVLGGAMAGLLATEAVRAAPIRAKVSKAKAQYQDQPMDVRSCATCSLFVAPAACKAVKGAISPQGWCNLYDLAD